MLSLLELYGIDQPAAVTLDIEGHEFAVMKGFFASASRSRWTEFLQLELHHNIAASAAVNIVREHGYSPCLRTRMNIILQKVSTSLRGNPEILGY